MRPSGWKTRKPRNAAAVARAKQYASPEHRAKRRDYAERMAKGEVFLCWRVADPSEGRCLHPNLPIRTGVAWQLGHDRHRRIRGTEHKGCNLSHAAREGAAVANAKRRRHPTVTRRALL